MSDSVLAIQMAQVWRGQRTRGMAIGMASGLVAIIFIRRFAPPSELIELLAWSQLVAALVIGSCLTGWRLSQLPKSRAVEFHLVTPLSDAYIVGCEIVCGLARTLLVMGSTLPGMAVLWGAGWIGVSDVLALSLIPPAAGGMAGVALAVVAFEPAWVRRLLERLVLSSVVAYLVLFGLLSGRFVPWFYGWWYAVTGTSLPTSTGSQSLISYFNPFRLLQSVSNPGDSATAARVLAVVAFLGTLSLLGIWRLVRRLRPHYYEENYGRTADQKEYRRAIGENPLAWWTRRRVSRFKGNINLYLAWTTIGLYSAWIMAGDRWPAWLAAYPLRLLEQLGGGSLLAIMALQLSVVPVAFLNGLWDSNTSQRTRRLELLLITPLSPKAFLSASMIAGWTRGRGYLGGALVMWLAMAFAEQISWTSCLALAVLSANYLLLSLAVAFRNFARLQSDQAVSIQGLIWSVGIPLITVGLFECAGPLAAWSPLGAVYLVSLPSDTSFTAAGVWSASTVYSITAAAFGWFGIAVWLLRDALVRFDDEIRVWFARQLAGASTGESGQARARSDGRYTLPRLPVRRIESSS